MKLITVSIYNFRCLKEVIDVPIYNLTVFIGENDAGKSSILDAIELCLSKKTPNEDDYFVREGEEKADKITIELTIQYTDKEEKPESKFLYSKKILKYRAVYSRSSVLV